MKWEGRRQSSNVEDRRGQSGGLGGGGLGDIFGGGLGRRGGIQLPRSAGGVRSGGMGLGTIVIIGLVMWFVFGINPLQLLGGMLGGSIGGPSSSYTQSQSPAPMNSAEQDRAYQFASVVMADTEDVWTQLFRASGQSYRAPKLVIYTSATDTACGTGQSGMGPFYCPGDQKVYIDLDFFNELATRFGAAGDFAQAYVIAHEVGHHIQTITGLSSRVAQAKSGASEEEANQLSVRQELQADCYAGVWAHHAQRMKSILEPGDLEEALRAASAVGDDTIQRQARGTVVPESFTHGSAEQRQRWFKTGFDTGSVQACDTFNVANP
ncbi:MAG: neutral zinc metallopeptidase [Micropepsaceae bacterium]